MSKEIYRLFLFKVFLAEVQNCGKWWYKGLKKKSFKEEYTRLSRILWMESCTLIQQYIEKE